MDIRKIMKPGEENGDLEEHLLTLDSEFRFKCRHCGKCCKNQDTILFNAKDIFNIAKKLGKTPKQVVESCAETYIGNNSRIPVVHMVPRGPKNACPLLLDDGRCSVHDCKPTVCALFPLGRVILPIDRSLPLSKENSRIRFILTDHDCGSAKKVHTVREWLAKFGIPEEDAFHLLWNEVVLQFSDTMRKLEERNCSNSFKEYVWGSIGHALYLNYDTSREFMPQFEATAEKIKAACTFIGEVDSYCFEGGPRPPFLDENFNVNL